MLRFFKRTPILFTTAGVLLGLLLALGAEKADQFTTTDAFCTGCHVMQTMAERETYLNSAHRTSATGIQAGCADCHVPTGLVAASWAHVRDGTRDLYVEMTTDFTPEEWQQRRIQLAHGVRDRMLADGSRNCRRCHDAIIAPTQRPRGQRQHELAERQGVGCIGCHFNLVHAAVEPRDEFLQEVQARLLRRERD